MSLTLRRYRKQQAIQVKIVSGTVQAVAGANLN
jgi:hypothetical protein